PSGERGERGICTGSAEQRSLENDRVTRVVGVARDGQARSATGRAFTREQAIVGPFCEPVAERVALRGTSDGASNARIVCVEERRAARAETAPDFAFFALDSVG